MKMIIGFVALLVVLPGVGVRCLMALIKQQRISLYTKQVAGKRMSRIEHRTVLVANRPLRDFDKWLHLMLGNYDLVGPTPLDFETASALRRRYQGRFSVSPGIVCPYTVKRAAGIAHQSELEVSAAFASGATIWRRIQILFVWSLQRTLRLKRSSSGVINDVDLFGVKIDNASMSDSINKVTSSMNCRRATYQPAKFAFVNADCVNRYYSDETYKTDLNTFEGVFADGIGVKMAARWQGNAIKENVNGTDMFPLLCDQLNEQAKRVFLLGATPAVVTEVAKRLAHDYPDLEVAGFCDGYSQNEQSDVLCQRINQSNADILFVAMGAPIQERWIAANSARLKVGAVIGVGGLFDFYSGKVSRAPEWLRELSLEWCWRLAVQPWSKWRRYLLGNPLFVMRVLSDVLANKYNGQKVGV